MSGFTNQKHVKNFQSATVSQAEALTNIREPNIHFVKETNKMYYYSDGSTASIDGLTVLNANGGAGRWLSITDAISAFQGDFDASGGILPVVRADGGDIQAGDRWMVSVAGTVVGLQPHEYLTPYDMIIARVDVPTVAGDWFSIQGNRDLDNVTIGKNVSDDVSIVNIDHIIGLDNHSIDGSHVIMSNAGRELVTREFVEDKTHGIWDTDNDTGIATEQTPDDDRLRFYTAGVQRALIKNTGEFLLGQEGQENATLGVQGDPTHNKIVNFRDSDGENIFFIQGTLAGGDSLFGMGDVDDVYGGPYIEFDQAADLATLGGPVDGVRLKSQPTGTVPLAVATTYYVDEAIAPLTKLTRYYGEEKLVTDGVATLPALNHLGTHGTVKVINLCVYLNGTRQNNGAANDYTYNEINGVITFNYNLVGNDVVLVDYDSQDA